MLMHEKISHNGWLINAEIFYLTTTDENRTLTNNDIGNDIENGECKEWDISVEKKNSKD